MSRQDSPRSAPCGRAGRSPFSSLSRSVSMADLSGISALIVESDTCLEEAIQVVLVFHLSRRSMG